MKSLPTWFSVIFLGLVFQTCSKSTSNFNQTSSETRQENRPGKRHTKFIIPALISHMYRQKLEDSPLSTILNRPSAKGVSKENEKRHNADHLEHKVIVGNPRRDENVRNVPKTKSPGVRRKASRVVVESQCHPQGEQSRSKQSNNDDNNSDGEGNIIQVSKHFSPVGRNMYAGPSVMWPPPYPNSYMPPEQYPNLRYPRPLYPGHSFQPEGILQHIMGQPRNRYLVTAESKIDAGRNRKIVAQERKFIVTNITKYVLDFYCPHCGGEISVSKNKNKGGLFASDEGAISINKGIRNPHSPKDKSTTPFTYVTKVQQMN